jgi:hypothetical protein
MDLVIYSHDVCYCDGVGQGRLLALSSEGIGCQKSMQGYMCVWNEKRWKQTSDVLHRMFCRRNCLSNIGIKHQPYDEMVSVLQPHGTQVCKSDDLHDIIDLFEILIWSKQAPYSQNDKSSKIKYPTKPSTYLKEVKQISNFLVDDGT